MTREDEHLSDDGVPGPTGEGTPSRLTLEDSAEALETLEFAAVLELVAAHAAGPLGAARVRARRPVADLAPIEEELARVTEMRRLLVQDREIRGEPVPEIGRALARLRIEGSVLDGPELVALRQVLTSARLTAGLLRRVEKDAPRSAALLRPVPDRALETRLEQSLDSDGRLLDAASPALAAARREVQAARSRLIQKLEAILRRVEGQGGEGTVTVRNGRYVIPVRRDERNRPDGIVHGESGSRGTLFVEPGEAIELGNALRAAEAEEEYETLRVLRELTERLRPEWRTIAGAHEMAVAVDDLVARARYALEADGHAPAMRPAPAPLVVRNGRHPLLLASGIPVVPFDLDLGREERTLVISGPNTGGKTVLLKAVGLAAAMAQSGIVPPVGAGTELPVFRRIWADIGDHQSIAASLSTFSAHVRLLSEILRDADAATLVLLDEVGGGTDPAEGAALAAASLLALTRRGAVTLATTHLGALKTLPARSPGVVNASLQFDAETLHPTYRFLKGVPGRSYGLAIARGLGVPEEVLAEAEAEVPQAERHLDQVLAAVERREREQAEREAALAEQALRLGSLEARLARQGEEQERREAELRRREREAERAARAQAKGFLLEARQRVEEAISQVRSAADEAVIREARRSVEEGVRAEAEALERLEREAAGRPVAAPAGPEPGASVQLASGLKGKVLEVRADGKLVVAVGAMRMVADAGDVVSSARAEPARRSAPAAVEAPAGPEAVMELDLRGMTGDEAEAATLAAVDAAFVAEQPFIRIIHGKGTGALRERVQRVVKSDRRVRRSDFAPAREGGTGVTIVELAR